MFLGEYQHSIDQKGRMIIPVKFRESLGQSFIVTRGLDNCLFVYTQSEWDILQEKINKLPVTDAGVRRFVRFFCGGASESEPDGQGRVGIPPHLREYAAIKKDIVSVGVSNRIEIWSKENWTSYNNDSNFIDNDLAIRMSELGI